MMEKLRKNLSDSAKDRRHRIHMINLHIAVVEWLVEFSGFFLIFLGSYILGHGSSTVTTFLQTITAFLLFNVLPCTLLINDDELKANIAESDYYRMVLKTFNCENFKRNTNDTEDGNREDDNEH